MTAYRLKAFHILLTIALAISLGSGETDTTFSENFDDGDLIANPIWTRYHDDVCSNCIAPDTTHYLSPPYSLKISTQSQLSAIESATRLMSASLPFEFTTHIYVESMGDEAIPCLLRGASTVMALFLLPKVDSMSVQLSVLKDTPEWNAINLNIPQGYALDQWHTFTIRFNGVDSTSLFIDSLYQGTVVLPLRGTPTTLQLGNHYVAHTSTFYVDDILITTVLPTAPAEPGTVYLILGSDTGTWNGLNVNQHDNFYTFGLFSDGNGQVVIDPAFRAPLQDSYGEPLVFTWWLIGGNMMIHDTNPETEYPWISNLEMIRKYCSEGLAATGDELALHYHNWVWSDLDSEGSYHWNQSVNLNEYRDDFLETIGRMVLEGDLMPTSFRSGWHYMSSEWSALIDSLIPYRLENDSPGIHDDTVEPLDNIYDWSRAPQEWVPYHPDTDDYQTPGDLKGWETRSKHLSNVDLGLLYDAFLQAYYGTDQVLTLWSHLPEVDFPEQIIRVDSLLKLVSASFPEVMYDYTTATDGMQKWRGITDKTPPVIELATTEWGDSVELTIEVNEPVWQTVPFTYADAGGEHLIRLFPVETGPLSWSITFDQSQSGYREIGLALTDTAGNAAVEKAQFEVVGIAEEVDRALPSQPMLYSAYPNPFNASTVLRYYIPDGNPVRLIIYNSLGREVVRLTDQRKTAGYHQLIWQGRSANGRELPSGMYLARMSTPGFTATVKIILLK
ncbi:T9SS type A sorting domain-containing protein [Candidatus Neomarinimicrobiota bacterium]